MFDKISQIQLNLSRIGKEYGFELNDAKSDVLTINFQDSITNANDIRIYLQERIIYSGALLNYNGRIVSELTRVFFRRSSRVHFSEDHVRITILVIQSSRTEMFRSVPL